MKTMSAESMNPDQNDKTDHDLGSNRRDFLIAGLILVFCVGLFFLDLAPAPFKEKGSKEKALVLETDDSDLSTIGLVRQGSQHLKVKILSGKQKGEIFSADNLLRAQMDLDKIFKPGDLVLVALYEGAEPETATLNAQDHYRLEWTVSLFALFALLLLVFGGWTGFKALLSFVFTCLVIWKLMVPLCLKGVDPVLLATIIVALLSAVIIFLVAGLNRKGITAFFGAFAGVVVSCLLAWIFTAVFRLNGAVMPYSQALLYSGYESLDLSSIYIGGIFLSSSGAVMDLGMDISAGMSEVVRQTGSISRRDLIWSGIRMGRSVVGTMTTTLLLAYSGGYLTLMMMFAAQGTSPVDFLNNPYVASEIVKTIIGSFGLVLVAPLTALIGGFLLLRNSIEK
ncbi:MAG: YibE/F family protein [Planctomycetia bacterium]|nr:YibE/F family protein [Planctomycetia bacterium]